MQMPEPDREVLAKRDTVIAALRAIVPGEGVIATEDELRAYECDGLTAYRTVPMAVVLPTTTEQVSRILRFCDRERVKVVPRGAGTSLSGGALPLTDGIVLGLGKFNRILDIDFENRTVTAQPGVTNLGITRAVEHARLLLRPRPLLADRLHHRRQHRRELGRRALPEIRPHHQQRAGPGDGAAQRRRDPPRRQAPRRRRLRPARPDDRLGRPARRRHRGHRPHPAASPRPRAPC